MSVRRSRCAEAMPVAITAEVISPLPVFAAALFALACCLAVSAGPAFAEGYNDGGYNYTSREDSATYGANSGIYVRDPVTATHVSSLSGPHGGYTTTTNKCQDCHSTHYALGSYMLLRSSTREDACTFCHAGGGGSSINIQMDNDYDSRGVDKTKLDADPIWDGYGVGHTLGYQGLSPADINPAYSSAAGFACFDCHTPHGNSTRVMTTFHNPGRRIGGVLTEPKSGGVAIVTRIWDSSRSPDDEPLAADPEGIDLKQYWEVNGPGPYYGEEIIEGNLVAVSAEGVIHPEPIWPSGRFLLLKNPHIGLFDDTVTAAYADPETDWAGAGADEGKSKIPIDWEEPLGRGFHVDGLEGGPGQEWLNFLTISEYCTDCHAGAAGLSTQKARVWIPSPTGAAGGGYYDVYHHDSNPRLRDEPMYIAPLDDNNYGNHCRKCHTGASTCRQCHGITPDGTHTSAYLALSSPYDEAGIDADGKTTFWAQPYVRRSAVVDVNSQCIDGGFSWPHRTLGVNLLKDELFGVDFDGRQIAAGEIRMSEAAIDAYFGLAAGTYLAGSKMASELETDTWRPANDDTYSILGAPAENMDSMCLDCHGDATYWNGDDVRYYEPDKGWNLILKGLP